MMQEKRRGRSINVESPLQNAPCVLGSERVDARHLEARARHDGREHHVGDAGCSLDAGLLLLKVRTADSTPGSARSAFSTAAVQ